MNLPVKYRPKIFEEVVGQEAVTRTLQNALKLKKISSAYLFTGPRGVGKTTVARLLAKGLNCEKGITPNPCNECTVCKEIDESRSIDVVEIDGASNRGIDDVRNLREKVKFLPQRGRFRVFIIDEVHMLTTEAFNALLKTLEEPPEHVIFIMATTEPKKVPETIVSRTQRFDFKPLTENVMVKRMREIAEREGIEVDDKALFLMAKHADGSMRDAIALLEQLSVFTERRIEEEDVRKLIGIPPDEFYRDILMFIKRRDTASLIKRVDEFMSSGYTPEEFLRGFEESLTSILRAKIGLTQGASLGLENLFEERELIGLMKVLLEMGNTLRRALRPRVWIDYYLLKMAYLPNFVEVEEILNKSRILPIGWSIERKVEPQKEEFLDEVNRFINLANERHPLIGSILKASSINFDNGVMVIKTGDNFQRELLERHEDIILNLMKELGRNCSITVLTEISDMESDPLARRVIELFDLEVREDV